MLAIIVIMKLSEHNVVYIHHCTVEVQLKEKNQWKLPSEYATTG